MSAKDFSPCNQDLLQSAKFILSIPRLTSTQFFCQAANIPAISAQPKIQNTPLLDLMVPGDKISFDTLNIEFLLDEQLQSWLAISDWMRGIYSPENSEQYAELNTLSKYSQRVKHPQYADAELAILSSSNIATTKIKFVDMFPVSLSGIDFDIRLGSDKTMTATASFRYKRYDTTVL